MGNRNDGMRWLMGCVAYGAAEGIKSTIQFSLSMPGGRGGTMDANDGRYEQGWETELGQ